MARQLMLTKENMRRFAQVGSQDGKGDGAIVVVKYFTPDSNWTWLATEMSFYDADDNLIDVTPEVAKADPDWLSKVDLKKVIFFGYVLGFDNEWGSFGLGEIMEARGPMGLPVERDIHCGEQTVGQHCGSKEG